MVDLFSGIGGFSLAASWVWDDELEIVCFCENDAFCQKVLKKHWPDVPIIEDVRDCDGQAFGSIQLLTGGFPCQPFSCAGRQKGIEDERHLWPQMLRVIQEAKPRWIIAENVTGLLSIDGGLVFESVFSSLEKSGYQVQPFIIPACSKDAPHRRDRLWILAYSAENGCISGENTQRCHMERFISKDKEQSRDRWTSQTRGMPKQFNTPNTRIVTPPSTIRIQDSREEEVESRFRSEDRFKSEMGTHFPSRFSEWSVLGKPYLVRDSNGIPDVLDRLGALGNAIVPQVAAEIMQAIKESDK